MIERATPLEHWPDRTKHSPVQRLQQRQWQALGTLYRTRANLYFARGCTAYKEEWIQIDQMVRLIDTMIDRNLAAQRTLPSKKNKKLGLVP